MTSEHHEKLFSGVAWLLIALILLALGLAVSFFKKEDITDNNSGLPPSTTRQPREYLVFYKAGVFGPTNIRIHEGDSVRFQNLSSDRIRIISDGGPKSPQLVGFDSVKDILPNGEYVYTFSRIGIFGYHNLNNSEEVGSVIVRP